ncbi:MAG: hypothetical protein Q4A09_09595, partial [Capnocytophaga felis]|nr:hypothetical protein [Capnocytophaga felis]
MPYKVDSVTGEMSEYIFDIGGVLALRNFTARTDGERLVIQSAANANFTILDALVSEVEIDGVVYDNPISAQEALQRLVFNPAVPVIMTLAQQQLLEGALQKGTYSGTASDLKTLLEELINKKVSQEQGKGLSTHDFTTALKEKLEELQNADLTPYLQKGGYEGTAKDLKTAIDAINTILQSDDSELDQLQEIVNYIKQNKKILSKLSISNIAGLSDALSEKSSAGHTHSYNNLEDKPTLLPEAPNDGKQYVRER